MVFPAPPGHLPDKDEVAEYLEHYAERFELPIRHDTRVESLRWDGVRYTIEGGGRSFEAGSVIVATGPFQSPRIPLMSGQLKPGIRQIHSSEYVSPFQLEAGPVLVVGAGNSGVQIALELAKSRDVILAGESPGYFPRTFLGRDIYDWIWPVIDRFTKDSRVGKLLQRRTAHADPIIGTTARQVDAAGIRRIGRLAEVCDGSPVYNGTPLDVNVVIWATGFAPDYKWIQLPLEEDRGRPVTRRGVVDSFPGLYFLGLRWQHRLTSALIGGVGSDAAFIADQIAIGATV